MSTPAIILTLFLMIAFIPKAHVLCIKVFSAIFRILYSAGILIFNQLHHIYKYISKKMWILVFIGAIILFLWAYVGSVVFIVAGVAGICLWLGYKSVRSISGWMHWNFGPTTVPTYTPPKDFSAAQVHFIVNDKWTKETVSISLIQMTLNGFLKVHTRKTNTREGVEIKTFVFTRTDALPKTEDEHLYDYIIGPDNSFILDNSIHPALNQFNKELAQLTKEKVKDTIYYTYPFQKKLLIIALCCMPLIYLLKPLGDALNAKWPGIITLGIVLMYALGSYVFKDKKHPVLKQINGLRMFLKTVCKNEDLNMDTSNIKDLLPYALALDVPNVWDNLLSSLDIPDKTLSTLCQPSFKQLIANAVEEVE